jgi:hypothetical protein
MPLKRTFQNEKGMAMVLALSMIALLSMFGVWMLVESQTSFRVTTSMERRQLAFNLAEGALQLGYRCLLDNPVAPSYSQLLTTVPVDITPTGLSYMAAGQNLGVNAKGTLTPTISLLTYSPLPPPGNMINWQGSSSFHSLYFRVRGAGTIPLPSNKGNARTALSTLTAKLVR